MCSIQANTSLKILNIYIEEKLSHLTITQLEKHSLPAVMLYGSVEKLFLKVVLLLNLVIGTGLRVMLLKTVKNQGDLLSKPFSIMIAVDELVKMVGCTTWIIFFLFAIDSEGPLKEKIGSSYCYLSQYLSSFAIMHSFTGGAGSKTIISCKIKLTSINDSFNFRYCFCKVSMCKVSKYHGKS